MINRFYRDEPDGGRAAVARRATERGAREAELGPLIARVLDPENPQQVEELARIGRQAASLSPAAQERLLASVPGMDAEQVREALRPWLHSVPARPTPTDSIERAPDFGPFGAGTAPPSATSEGPPTVSVGSLQASVGGSSSVSVVSRARAWRDPVDGDRAVGRSPRPTFGAAVPEPSAEGGVAVQLMPAAAPPATEIGAESVEEPRPPALAEPGPSTPVSPVSPMAASVGEAPIPAAWLAEREGALVAIRADYEAARAQAMTAPGGPGWQTTFPVNDDHGHGWSADARSAGPNQPVWLADPNGAQELVRWSEGEATYRPVGRFVAFDEEAFAAQYRAAGGEPLQRLAEVYDPSGRSDAASLLAAHSELWSIATSDHALNAGPPLPGFAMAAAGQLGMVDLYLADPQIAALVDAYGGPAAPATGGIAIEQARLYGERRFEQMSRFANAMASVRTQYTDALAQAQQRGEGPGWVEREYMGWVTSDAGDSSTTVNQLMHERVFDPDVFTDWYLAQDALPQQAFASIYGRSHTEYSSSETESGARTTSLSMAFDNPNWSLSGSGSYGPLQHGSLLSLDPNHPPRLNNDSAVGFDFEAGWVTAYGNVHQRRDWVETAAQVAFVAAVCYFSAGTLGAEAALAVEGAGYGAAAGAAASAAVVGAAGSVASGMISGNLTFRSVLQGALSGALSAGLMNSALAEAANAAAGTAGTIALRTTVQGGIQALLGGSFSEGARAALAAGLADAAGANLRAGIDEAVATGTMSAGEAAAASRFARVLGSAIRAAGNPGDPGHAFASDFLGETVRQALPPLPTPTTGATQTAAVTRTPAVTQTQFDDEGNPMPGIGNAPAPSQEEQPQPAADPARDQGAPEAGQPPQPAPTTPPPMGDPFLTSSDDDDPSHAQLLSEQLGIPREDVVNAGWLDDAGRSLGRSYDVLRGFAEGAGFSVLDTGTAVMEIIANSRQFINGVQLLLTSAEARAQFGEEVVTRIRADLLLLEDAWNADDMRGIGQQVGKLTTDLAQLAGGVEALARLGISAASAGGRLLLGVADAAAVARGAAQELRSVGLAASRADSLVETLALSSTRGAGNRVVLGRVVEGGGFVREAVENGGVYFNTADDVFDALGRSKDFAWAVNERFLLNQLRAGIARFDFVGESIASIETNAVGSFRWQEIQYLRANASRFGYELRGNSWIKVGP